MTTPLCFSPPILPLTHSPPLSTSHEFKKPHLVICMCSKVCNHLLEYKYPFKATSLKKNDCPPPRCDHLPIASKLGMGLDNTLSVHAGIFGLLLCRSCICSRNFHEFMCAATLLCLSNIFLLQTSATSSFYSLHNPLFCNDPRALEKVRKRWLI